MNWKSILLTAFVTGIVTLGTGMLLFWWQAKEAKLTYNYVKSISFDDIENKVFIQQFEIANTGTQIAENVSLIITFPQSTIEKIKIKIDDTIKYTKKIEENSITLEIESLNPQENLSLSTLIKSKADSLSDPKISLRAKGLLGKKIGDTKDTSTTPMIIALIASYAGLLAAMMSIKRLRNKISEIIFGQQRTYQNQKDIIASLLSMYGFPEKAREYLNYGSKRLYWVEADLLASEALEANPENKNKILKILIELAEIERINPSSKAIIFYNIARIYKSLKVEDNVIEYLSKAKAVDKSEIERRLLKDPIFIES